MSWLCKEAAGAGKFYKSCCICGRNLQCVPSVKPRNQFIPEYKSNKNEMAVILSDCTSQRIIFWEFLCFGQSLQGKMPTFLQKNCFVFLKMKWKL